jgi:hypothetical protein
VTERTTKDEAYKMATKAYPSGIQVGQQHKVRTSHTSTAELAVCRTGCC